MRSVALLVILAAGGITACAQSVDAPETERRPAALMPLYYTVASLHTADIISTSIALKAGGREANPLVAALGDDTWKITAARAASVAGTIFAAEYLWKHGHRKLAVTSVVLVTAFQVGVVVNNARIAQGLPNH